VSLQRQAILTQIKLWTACQEPIGKLILHPSYNVASLRHAPRGSSPFGGPDRLLACWRARRATRLAGETPDSLAARYASEVDRRLLLPPDEAQRYGALALQSLRAEAIAPILPQYLVLVDRSPQVQALLLFWLTPLDEAVLIGASPISTGRGGEFEYFETPTGVFAHNPANPDFRAEGTVNEKGIAASAAGARASTSAGTGAARLDNGSTAPPAARHRPQRLGPCWVAVQGHRAPTTLIQLLDRYGLLDADYDAPARRPASGCCRRSAPRARGQPLPGDRRHRAHAPDWSPAPARRPPPRPHPAGLGPASWHARVTPPRPPQARPHRCC
jgi:hypothetical protein